MIGTRIGGGYVLTRLLGEGGMGAVYAAEHEVLGTKKAVKVLLPRWTQAKEIVQRFVREARTAAGIGHRNVITVDDFGYLPDGQMFMMMPFLAGKGLDDVVRQWGRFTAEDALEVLAQVCAGLQAAHHRGVVHRDLKPANIFLTQENGLPRFVRILDFGIAKLTDEDGDGINTRTGQVFGTISYMAPEQAIGARELDHRCDIFALGVIAYQLLSGRVPYDGTSVGAIAVQHVQTRPDMSSLVELGVPAGFAAAIGQALSYRPNDRPSSAAAFARMLMEATPGGREIVQRAAPEIIELAAPVDATLKQTDSGAATGPVAPSTRAGHAGAMASEGRGGLTMSMPPGGAGAGLGLRGGVGAVGAVGAVGTVGAAGADVSSISDGVPVQKGRTTLTSASGVREASRGTARAGRRRWAIIAAAAGAVAVAAVVIVVATSGPGESSTPTPASGSAGEQVAPADPTPPDPAPGSAVVEPPASDPVVTAPAAAGSGATAAADASSSTSADRARSSSHRDRGGHRSGSGAKSEPASVAEVPKTEPAKTEPAKTEPAKTEPKATFDPDNIAND